MTDANTQSGNPPAGGTPPAAGGDGGAGSPPPPTATRPDWLPEAHWDAQTNAIKPDFGAHYNELATFHKTQTEAQAALAARKPDDIKFEVKLPDTVKVPDGFQVTLDDKDPRLPLLRDLAVKHQWSQETVDSLVALDAQQKIAAHTAEMERIAAEDAKLGANGKARKEAVATWAKGLFDRKEISEDEYQEIRSTAAFAAGVTLLEKLIAKATGGIPGAGGTPSSQPKPADLPMENRWYSQQKVS